MTTSRADALARQTLNEALATNKGRIQLFRLLASYAETDGFEAWCNRWRANPNDPEVFAFWDNLHMVYVTAWMEMGDRFWVYLGLGHSGLRRLNR